MTQTKDEQSNRGELLKRYNRVLVGAIGITFFVLSVFGIVHYRFHLWWLIQEHQHSYRQFVAIPDIPMPKVTVPDGWRHHRVGCLGFSLPPEITTDVIHRGDHKGGAVFESGQITIFVGQPTLAADPQPLLATGFAETFGTSTWRTMPQIKLECYRADTSIFRWSMSPSQVRRYMYIMALCRIIRGTNEFGSRVEYQLDNDIDVTLFLRANSAILDWESRRKNVGGYVLFHKHEDDENWNWVRAFCRSITVVHEPTVPKNTGIPWKSE